LNQPESLTVQAYAHIKSDIISGKIPAGGQVDSKAMSEQLGVSRTPVREAILRLANEGIVEVSSRKGMRVLPLSVDDLRNIYQVVSALEVEAVFLMASLPHRTEGLAALGDACARMDDAVRNEDGEAWNLADEQFHRALLEHSGNPRLAEAGCAYRDRAQRAHFVALRLVPLSQKATSVGAHRDLVAKIEAGDAYNARELHRNQRIRGSDLLVSSLRTLRLEHL